VEGSRQKSSACGGLEHSTTAVSFFYQSPSYILFVAVVLHGGTALGAIALALKRAETIGFPFALALATIRPFAVAARKAYSDPTSTSDYDLGLTINTARANRIARAGLVI
jgi:hypothetical protein